MKAIPPDEICFGSTENLSLSSISAAASSSVLRYMVSPLRALFSPAGLSHAMMTPLSIMAILSQTSASSR